MENSLSQRCKKIIYILIQKNDYIPVSKIAKALNVSNKTIRRDLKKIEISIAAADDVEGSILKKPGYGIKFKVSNKESLKIKEKNSSENHFGKRRHNLILHAFFSENGVNKDYILDKFDISISTYHNDLHKIKERLEQYKLEIKYRDGKNYICGDELNLRMLITQNIIALFTQEDKEDILFLLNNGLSIPTSENKYLKDCCPGFDLKIIRDAVYFIEEKTGFNFNSKSLLYFIIYTAVSLNRYNKNKKVSFTKNNEHHDYIKNLITKRPFNTAKETAEQLAKKFVIKLSQDEILAYLIQVCLNVNVFNKKVLYQEDYLDEINNTSSKTIDFFINHLNIKLSNRNHIQLILNLYFRALLIQQKFNLPYEQNLEINNFELDLLKSTHPYIFEISEEILDLINAELNIKINKNEVYYITIIFLTELEAQKDNIKALIIYDKSLPIKRLMLKRLNNNFPAVDYDFIDYNSLYRIDEKLLSDYDLYISTEKYENFPQAVVITPIVTQFDIKKIKNKIHVIQDLKLYL